MEKKQTAVRWLLNQINEAINYNELDNGLLNYIDSGAYIAIVKTADEMFSNQLIECFLEADADAYRKEPKYKTPQDYIRQTYEHNNQH